MHRDRICPPTSLRCLCEHSSKRDSRHPPRDNNDICPSSSAAPFAPDATATETIKISVLDTHCNGDKCEVEVNNISARKEAGDNTVMDWNSSAMGAKSSCIPSSSR
ncbi:uncharacterized protein BDZ99DRAFT_528153 [Mytilinidion resinicola]|uniref:Uncharacterized protein n=1 Tax=Mytilinidion resinicola TaxID=574789 RepID=A0A6A6XYV2_9PEZI|nr:uncharacterized protein BDZ99DRAFT_528153 [Mytilinidion resinicola]KAF2801682.1 hypothetical protein BDZ99DRAFT_528153 [Mytilinidion resinicola]